MVWDFFKKVEMGALAEESAFVQGSGAMAGTKSAAAKFRTKAETQYCKHQIAGSRVSSQGPVPQGAAAWR